MEYIVAEEMADIVVGLLFTRFFCYYDAKFLYNEANDMEVDMDPTNSDSIVEV